jgi:hypothetical protein
MVIILELIKLAFLIVVWCVLAISAVVVATIVAAQWLKQKLKQRPEVEILPPVAPAAGAWAEGPTVNVHVFLVFGEPQGTGDVLGRFLPPAKGLPHRPV